jgi:hypothetical protein
MKMHFTKAFATAALLFAGFAGSAQTNLGADCGCPAVGSRTTVNVTSLAGATAIAGDPDAFRLTSGATFTCNNTYILDKKIYVPLLLVLLLRVLLLLLLQIKLLWLLNVVVKSWLPVLSLAQSFSLLTQIQWTVLTL